MKYTAFQRLTVLVAATLAGSAGLAWAQEAQAEGARHETDYVTMLLFFMLATFIGLGVIQRVSRLLHTPLMSLTNAISAIAVVGAILVAGPAEYPTYITVLGCIALFASMTNIVSGFLITDRMLRMFREKERRPKADGGNPGAAR